MWWVGSSPSCVEYHSFIDVFLQTLTFQTESRASCPRELRKARLNKEGSAVAKPRQMSFPRKIRVGESRVGSELRFLRAPGNWCEVMTSNRQDKVGVAQYANLRSSIPWEGLQEPAATVESRRGNVSTRLEDQRIDLGIIYVDNDESLCSSWTKLQWQFGIIQEHQLRSAQ